MTDEREQSAREVFQAALKKSSEPDPRVVCRRRYARLTDAQQREVVERGLCELAKEAERFNRMAATASTKPGVSRWEQMRRQYSGGEWHDLHDLGVDELLALADDYRDRAARNAQRADELAQLARDLEASGCSTLGEMWASREAAA